MSFRLERLLERDAGSAGGGRGEPPQQQQPSQARRSRGRKKRRLDRYADDDGNGSDDEDDRSSYYSYASSASSHHRPLSAAAGGSSASAGVSGVGGRNGGRSSTLRWDRRNDDGNDDHPSDGGGGGNSSSGPSSAETGGGGGGRSSSGTGSSKATVPTGNNMNHQQQQQQQQQERNENNNDDDDDDDSSTNLFSVLLGSVGEDSAAFGDDYDHGQFRRRRGGGGASAGASSRDKRRSGGDGRRLRRGGTTTGRGGRGGGGGRLEERLSRLDGGRRIDGRRGGRTEEEGAAASGTSPNEIRPRRTWSDVDHYDDVSSITFDRTYGGGGSRGDGGGGGFATSLPMALASPPRHPPFKKPPPTIASGLPPLSSSTPPKQQRRASDSWILAVSVFVILGTAAFKTTGLILDLYGIDLRGGVEGAVGPDSEKGAASVPTVPAAPTTRESIVDSFTTTRAKRAAAPSVTESFPMKKKEGKVSGSSSKEKSKAVDGRKSSLLSSLGGKKKGDGHADAGKTSEKVRGGAVDLVAANAMGVDEEDDDDDATESTKGGARETSRFRHFMRSVSAATSSHEFRDENGPRYRALDWLANHDPRRLTEHDPLILQRYVLAVLYFEMTDDGVKGKKGKHKSVRGSSSSGAAASNPNNGLKNWLTGMHECAWKGEEGGVLKCTKQGHVTDLSLFGGVSGTIPPEIGSLERLEVLELSNNKLHGKIPSTLGDLRKLEYLGLDKNNLSGTVPGYSFGKMTHLREVRLERNNLHGTIKWTDPLCELKPDTRTIVNKGGAYLSGKIERLSADCRGFLLLSGAKVSCECCTHCYRG